MKVCPLCGLPVETTDLARHYLKDQSLIGYIRAIYPKWVPENGGCAPCLEAFSRDRISKETSQAKAVPIDEQTVITAGEQIIPPQAEKGAPSLIVIHGVDLGRKFDLGETETIIGRGENVQIRVNEENVSRAHAKVVLLGEEVLIEDLNSTNGTFVNMRKIEAQPLKDGDLVVVGNTILKFMSGSTVENQYHEEIYRLATRDGLTQLNSKNFFLEKLAEEFSRSRRYGRELTLLLLDFDHFKKVNDTHGHLAGDDVLKKTAFLILKNMRKEDICGRYGGEELGVLLPETTKLSAIRLAEKLRKLVKQMVFEHGGKPFGITISVGVAALTKEIKTFRQLLEAADRALYQAKADGRDCVRS